MPPDVWLSPSGLLGAPYLIPLPHHRRGGCTLTPQGHTWLHLTCPQPGTQPLGPPALMGPEKAPILLVHHPSHASPPGPRATAHLVKRMSASYLRWKRRRAVLSPLVLSSSSLSLRGEPGSGQEGPACPLPCSAGSSGWPSAAGGPWVRLTGHILALLGQPQGDLRCVLGGGRPRGAGGLLGSDLSFPGAYRAPGAWAGFGGEGGAGSATNCLCVLRAGLLIHRRQACAVGPKAEGAHGRRATAPPRGKESQ